jgi:hypothetical protein
MQKEYRAVSRTGDHSSAAMNPRVTSVQSKTWSATHQARHSKAGMGVPLLGVSPMLSLFGA